MPSPKSQSRYSNGSVLRSSTGAAVRRGDIHISEPIPIDDNNNPFYATNPRPNSDWPIKPSTDHDTQRGRYYSTGNLQPGDAGRASMGPSLVPSSAPSKNSGGQKKSTGFRATLRRMFSSKKARDSFGDAADFHRSDPGNLTAITESGPSPYVTQTPSQPDGRVTRTSALGSHTPTQAFHQDVGSDEVAPSPPTSRRRNTLPSLVITEQMAQSLGASITGDFTRQHKRDESSDKRLNRRSRSADALNKLISEFNFREANARDRESDIAYWRKSIIDHPVPSYPAWQQQDDDVTQSTTSIAQRSTELSNLQTFDFGLNERAGREATLEDRVNTLEVKLIDFEYAIAKLQGREMPKAALSPKVLKRRSIHDLFPETDSGMSSSSHEPTSFLSSPDASPLPVDEPEDSGRPDRSSKATTIRPFTARRRSNASPSPVRITVDQFDKLMDILRREQTARRRLEAQVNDLQKEIEALRAPVYAEIREVEHSTPGRSTLHDSPNTNRTLRRSPPFSAIKDDKQVEQSRFSMSDADSDTDPYDEVYETPQDSKFKFDYARSPSIMGVS